MSLLLNYACNSLASLFFNQISSKNNLAILENNGSDTEDVLTLQYPNYNLQKIVLTLISSILLEMLKATEPSLLLA